jgi:hypothetical protein
MATVEVFTKARMLAIEEQAIVNADLRPGSGSDQELILIRNNDTEINVGNVRGPIGVTPTVPDELQWSYVSGVVNASRPAPDSVPLVLKTGSAVITTDITAEDTVPFGSAFTGIFSVFVQLGDEGNANYRYLNGIDFGSKVLNTGLLNFTVKTYTTTGFNVKLTVPPVEPGAGIGQLDLPVGVGNCGPVRINWLAIGW